MDNHWMSKVKLSVAAHLKCGPMSMLENGIGLGRAGASRPDLLPLLMIWSDSGPHSEFSEEYPMPSNEERIEDIAMHRLRKETSKDSLVRVPAGLGMPV